MSIGIGSINIRFYLQKKNQLLAKIITLGNIRFLPWIFSKIAKGVIEYYVSTSHSTRAKYLHVFKNLPKRFQSNFLVPPSISCIILGERWNSVHIGTGLQRGSIKRCNEKHGRKKQKDWKKENIPSRDIAGILGLLGVKRRAERHNRAGRQSLLSVVGILAGPVPIHVTGRVATAAEQFD